MSIRHAVLAALTVHAFSGSSACSGAETVSGDSWFGIQVVDKATGRGVPLVTLRTVSKLVFVTDSNGWVAIHEPGWEGQEIWFSVFSHGYHVPKDMFGNRGKAIRVRHGQRVKIEIERQNIAERMYRLTGEGIYRDSVILGEKVPLKDPLLCGRVFGQDTVFATPYRGRMYWLWGDTDRDSYPLGNFRTSMATSLLPGSGGLSPDQGVDYTYFVRKDGFCKEMCPWTDAKDRLVWMGALVAVPDKDGRERLIAHYLILKGLGKDVAKGIATFDDEKEIFVQTLKIADLKDWRTPSGHPFRVSEEGKEYVVFSSGSVRVPATYEAVHDQSQYEAFTCVQDGAKEEGARTPILRDAAGAPAWRWTRSAEPLKPDTEKKLIKAGVIPEAQSRCQRTDAATGESVQIANGSVFWNAYLRKWVFIGMQKSGKPSQLGEIWFGAAPSCTGPFRKLVRVVTHDKYTFYNPTQHPEFDQENGRYIYFEGTYVTTFSATKTPTPRYDYNQIMYRLDLGDPRLKAVLEDR